MKVFSDEGRLRAAFVAGPDALASHTCPPAGRPTRSCKASGFKTTSVVASSEDSVGLLKMKLFESCLSVDLAPAHQRLFTTRGVELERAQLTLRDYEVRADEALFVLHLCSGEEEEDVASDWWSELGARETEAGFGGSALMDSTAPRRPAEHESLLTRQIVDLSEAEEEAQLQRAIEQSQIDQ